jgi:hypothetical protein
MSRSPKNQTAPAAANLAATSGRLDVPVVAAAWPPVVSPLVRAIEACEHSGTVGASAKADAPSLPTFWSHDAESVAKSATK